jgi:hypothetical protein
LGTLENKKDLALLQSLDNQSGKYRNRTDDLLTASVDPNNFTSQYPTINHILKFKFVLSKSYTPPFYHFSGRFSGSNLSSYLPAPYS